MLDFRLNSFWPVVTDDLLTICFQNDRGRVGEPRQMTIFVNSSLTIFVQMPRTTILQDRFPVKMNRKGGNATVRERAESQINMARSFTLLVSACTVNTRLFC